MNAQEIIEYIRTADKKTPVRVTLSEKKPVEIRSYIQYNRMCTGFYESLPAEKL